MITRPEPMLLRAITTRCSARAFSSDPVPSPTIGRILEAGRRAPSGANQQPWRFIVIREPDSKRAIRSACEAAERRIHRDVDEPLRSWMQERRITDDKPFLEQAPVLIAVFFEPRSPYAVPSVWIAIAFMLLQIEEEDLSSLPYTPSGAAVHALLGVPEQLVLAAILPVGRSLQREAQPRKRVSDVVSLERYDRPYPEPSSVPPGTT